MNDAPKQPETVETPTDQLPPGGPTEGADFQEPPVPEALRDVDPAQLAVLRDKLKKYVTSGEKTISGSEAPADSAAAAENTGSVTTGKDVDWSEYELDFSVKHLYPQATFRMTAEGPKWVAVVDEFYSTERDWRSHGKRVNVPGAVDKSETEPINAGEYLNDMLNSPEGWTVVSILPGSSGRVGLLLRRPVPVVLPDPKPLKKETEVEAPKDPELQRTEDAALAFMEKEGLVASGITNYDEPPADGPPSPLVEQALSINPPTERNPGPFADHAEVDFTEEAAKGAADALGGEDFGDMPAA